MTALRHSMPLPARLAFTARCWGLAWARIIYLGAVVALLVPFCLLAGHVLAGTGTRRMAGQGLAFIAGFGLRLAALRLKWKLPTSPRA